MSRPPRKWPERQGRQQALCSPAWHPLNNLSPASSSPSIPRHIPSLANWLGICLKQSSVHHSIRYTAVHDRPLISTPPLLGRSDPARQAARSLCSLSLRSILPIPAPSSQLILRSFANSNMSFHPHTPQSPSQNSPGTSSETIASLATSTSTMATTPALPTPAHSVNGISQHDVVMTDDTPQKRKRSIDDTGDRDQKKMFLEEYKLGIDDLHRDVGQKYLLCQARKAPSAALFLRLCPLFRAKPGSRQSRGNSAHDIIC